MDTRLTMHWTRWREESAQCGASTPSDRQHVRRVANSTPQGVAAICFFGRITRGFPILSSGLILSPFVHKEKVKFRKVGD